MLKIHQLPTRAVGVVNIFFVKDQHQNELRQEKPNIYSCRIYPLSVICNAQGTCKKLVKFLHSNKYILFVHTLLIFKFKTDVDS